MIRSLLHNCVVHPLLGAAYLLTDLMERLHDMTAPAAPTRGDPE